MSAVSLFANRSAEALIALWSRSPTTPAPGNGEEDSAEALWEYWRRVAEGELEFRLDLFQQALANPRRMLGNVLGELARRDRLPRSAFDSARRAVDTLPAGERSWARAQLRARVLLADLRRDSVRSLTAAQRDDLVQPGLGWAALEAISVLSCHACEGLRDAAASAGCFTRAQQHRLRRAVGVKVGSGASEDGC